MSRGIIIFRALGTGKTTVGAELAQPLNFQHFDLDDFHL
ncbi:shikimate kinase [Anaerocolumna sp. AGMB13020]